MAQCPRCGPPEALEAPGRNAPLGSVPNLVSPPGGGVYVSRRLLRSVLEEFICEHSTNTILERVPISTYKLLMDLRVAMTKDVPPVFSGIVEVDETDLGGQWRNKRKSQRRQGTRRGRGTSKQPVLGILCREGKVWAKMVPDVETRTLLPLIRRQVRRGSTVYSDGWRGSTGIATLGYVIGWSNTARGTTATSRAGTSTPSRASGGT